MKFSKMVTGLLVLATMAFQAHAAEFVPNELIVKYRDGAERSRLNLNSMYDMAGVKRVKRFKGMMRGFEQLVLADSVKLQDALAELNRNPMVEYAHPNYIVRVNPIRTLDDEPTPPDFGGGMPCIPGFDIPGCDPNLKLPCLIPGLPFPPGCEDGGGGGGGGPTPPPATRPDLQDPPADLNPPVADPDLAKAYGIEKIGSTQAWVDHKGSKELVVAVIDTGIDYNHEDLSFNVWRNPNPGEKKDVVGYDFVHDDGLPFDDNQHGTHCAGTIGAVGGNGKGVSGVNQRVSIMGVKFLSGEGSGTTADAIRSIDYAVTHGAKVLSNSWGGYGDDDNKGLREAIERARAKDVLFIAAAGNESRDNDGSNPSFPASLDNDNLIAVAATDKNDGLASFSNIGKTTVDLGAPGVGVYSTVPGNGYSSLSGTSMACPHVAGAAAMLWSRNPTWNYKKVKDVLLKSVDPVASLAGKTLTGGRLNILKALRSTD